jgi:hypothetical protein
MKKDKEIFNIESDLVVRAVGVELPELEITESKGCVFLEQEKFKELLNAAKQSPSG